MLLLIRAASRPGAIGRGVPLAIALFLIPLAMPQGATLRYSIIMLAAGYSLLLVAVRRVPRRVAGPALCIGLCINVADWGRAVGKEVAAQVRGGVSLLAPERNFDWYLGAMYIEPGLDPRIHRAVRTVVRPGERLVYCINGLSGLLYDPGFTYAIEFRSVASLKDRRAAPVTGAATEQDIRAWLESLRRDGIAAVMVYAGSVEDRALEHSWSGYLSALEGPTDGRWPAARVYRRAE
jgi:hypothetical protein